MINTGDDERSQTFSHAESFKSSTTMSITSASSRPAIDLQSIDHRLSSFPSTFGRSIVYPVDIRLQHWSTIDSNIELSPADNGAPTSNSSLRFQRHHIFHDEPLCNISVSRGKCHQFMAISSQHREGISSWRPARVTFQWNKGCY